MIISVELYDSKGSSTWQIDLRQSARVGVSREQRPKYASQRSWVKVSGYIWNTHFLCSVRNKRWKLPKKSLTGPIRTSLSGFPAGRVGDLVIDLKFERWAQVLLMFLLGAVGQGWARGLVVKTKIWMATPEGIKGNILDEDVLPGTQGGPSWERIFF